MKPETRRQFLRGAAGFTLALPFLESLAPRKSFAGDPPYAANPRLVLLTTQHGAVWNANMYPGDAAAPNTLDMYAGHRAHWGPLSAAVAGGTATISPLLRASSSKLSSELVSKMNVLRGLDIMMYMGHHQGGELGNFARAQDNADATNYRPTIDQVLAYSPSFYPNLTSIRERSMHIGTHANHAWGYSNPTDPDNPGQVEPIPLAPSPLALFERIFVPDPGPDPRPLVVDRVIASYRGLRDGRFGDAARLSSKDRQRLDEHMARLHDLETRLKAVANCGDVDPPADTPLEIGEYSANIDNMTEYYQRVNDVIVAAFVCGTSRIAVVNSGETWSTQYPGLCCDWHQNVAHIAGDDQAMQGVMLDAKRRFFESVFVDLADKLNHEEADGITYLDNSLIWWTEESGHMTHENISQPVITAGSAAGVLETGRYVDYRNRSNMALGSYPNESPDAQSKRPGLPLNRWLATVLRAMGLPPSEFQRPGERGYGITTNERGSAYPSELMSDASKWLPLLEKQG
jgi:hypothetical protein